MTSVLYNLIEKLARGNEEWGKKTLFVDAAKAAFI